METRFVPYPGFKVPRHLLPTAIYKKKAASQLVWRQPLCEEDCWEKEINEKNIKSRGINDIYSERSFKAYETGTN